MATACRHCDGMSQLQFSVTTIINVHSLYGVGILLISSIKMKAMDQ